MGHLSLLDGAAIPADPYRLRSIPVVKHEMANAPIIGWALEKWGAIPAMRDDHDMEAVRRILIAFNSGRVLCITPAGKRSRTGRLDPLQPTAVKLAMRASREMPVFPMAVVNAYEALPPEPGFPNQRDYF